jgi:phage-related protein
VPPKLEAVFFSTLKGRIARVLFTVTAGEMVLLHGFVKKTHRTPVAEIELAQCRWKEWQDAQAQ